MSYYGYGEGEPKVFCPYCNERVYAEYVDVGVAMQQVTAHYCDGCDAAEAGPYCDITQTNYDKETGWFKR